MNAKQTRMARVALGIGVRELAASSGVSQDTVSRHERGEELRPITLAQIQSALEKQGIEFVLGSGRTFGVMVNPRRKTLP